MPLYTCCVAGPASTRANAEVALESARIPLLPSDHHEAGWGAPKRLGLDPEKDAVVVCQCPDPSIVAESLPEGWGLRMHFHATEPPQSDPIAATLDDMRREIADLRAKVEARP